MDDAGFAQWYRAEHPRLVAALTVVARDVTIAAEVVDEACVRACERWPRVRAMQSPVGWTFRTALNVLRRRHRRALMEANVTRRTTAGSPGVAPPSDWSIEVWDAVTRLPTRERTAIALRYVADLSTDEIAHAMRVAPGTVGSTLHAARHRLAELLADESPTNDLEEVRDA